MSGADDLARLTVTIDKANELFLSEEPKMVDVGGGVMRPTNAKVLADLATQMNGAQIYTSVALGLASTAQDSYFSVPSSEAREYLILYQNSAGAAREVDRYPSILAVDDVLGLISPSNNSPHIGASVTDADGFELLQIHTDGLMKSAAFEIDKTGVQTERLALQSLYLPHVDSSISIMDADGFHFPLDIKYPGVSPASPVSTLAELRDSLANELEDICIRVCADSIGWGMTGRLQELSATRLLN